MAKRALERPSGAQGDLFSPAAPISGARSARAGRLAESGRTARLRAPGPGAAAPFLKWAGGKGQLLSQLFPLFPSRAAFGTYHEPFVGGGAVFFALAPHRAVLSDLNPDLVTCYEVIRARAEELIAALSHHVYEKEHYYQVRALDPTALEPVARAARFIYLNRTCFNGLHRVNRRGQFNVPFGRYTNPTICDADNLRRVSAALQGSALHHEGFEAVLDRAQRGDLVYFDPPYQPISATSSFTAYTQHSFGRAQQERLAEVFRALDRKGAKVMLSNSNAQFIRDLYRGYDVREVLAARHINRDPTRRGPIAELVVRNFAR